MIGTHENAAYPRAEFAFGVDSGRGSMTEEIAPGALGRFALK